MLMAALIVALPSAALFCTLTLMGDRKRGALVAQGALVLAVIGIFLAIVAEGPVAGLSAVQIAGIATGLIASSVAGMLYHLYLGRFTRVWAARGVFTLVYLGLAAVFGLIFPSQI